MRKQIKGYMHRQREGDKVTQTQTHTQAQTQKDRDRETETERERYLGVSAIDELSEFTKFIIDAHPISLLNDVMRSPHFTRLRTATCLLLQLHKTSDDHLTI